MKRSILVLASLLLAACSAAPTIPSHVQTHDAAIQRSGGSLGTKLVGPANGGAFSASYSGQYSLTPCGTFKIVGSGYGSFIHKSSETGTMGIVPNMECNSWSGQATLVNTLRPRNTITVMLSATGTSPCTPRIGTHVGFGVISGTGRFAHATGGGTIKFTCNSDGTYTDHWSGTISF